MHRHTSWRVGGPADRFYLPGTLEDLQAFLQGFAVAPLTWLGLGSNVLVRDGGLRGTVICLANTWMKPPSTRPVWSVPERARAQ
jgi:UDP-N-acetylmuramate dehydrogenase (EC 1.1.1.158)